MRLAESIRCFFFFFFFFFFLKKMLINDTDGIRSMFIYDHTWLNDW